ncbi:reverse transcriptase domain-containing protein [Tanacetum coccineum]
MSTRIEPVPASPTSVVRNTVGKGNGQHPENPKEPASDAALREYCDKHYHQLLPLIAEKVHQEKVQQEKLKEVKARLNFEGCSRRNSKVQEESQYSESRTPNIRGEHGRRRRSRRSWGSREENGTCKIGKKGKGCIQRVKKEVCPHTLVTPNSSSTGTLAGKRKAVTKVPAHRGWKRPQRVKKVNEGTRSQDQKKQKSSIEEDDLSQPWVCEETDPFTPRIRYFDFLKKTRMPSNVKTYDGSDDPKDHLKIFQAAAKVECWAMPTWCHMFNSTLTGSARVWFDDLPPESVDSYDDLKKAFLANFLQQKKCIKDPIEIHHIKQKEGESTEDFVQRFKNESRHVKGAPKCMRISRFMHGITNPELIKRLHDKISKSVDEMMRVTTSFLRGEVAASNQVRKKTPLAWKQQETGRKQIFDKRGGFRN